MAMVGRSAAVADLGRIKMKGLVGWLLWSVVHLFFLIGARNRFAVYLNWVWAWLTYGRGARLITRVDDQARQELGRLGPAGAAPRDATSALMPAMPVT